MTNWIALALSALALVVSGVTAWLTLFRTGQLRMTQPTVIFFGPDGGRGDTEPPRPKVFLRTLLFSTSQRGQTLESMHVSLQRNESKQNFSIWVYGVEQLVRGSGLHVARDGMATNHHFLLPADGASFSFLAGQYALRVYTKRVADRAPIEVHRETLIVTDAQAAQLAKADAGIYFDWGPDQQAYHAHVEVRKQAPVPPWLLHSASTVPSSVDG